MVFGEWLVAFQGSVALLYWALQRTSVDSFATDECVHTYAKCYIKFADERRSLGRYSSLAD
jgi:hypothetical protein